MRRLLAILSLLASSVSVAGVGSLTWTWSPVTQNVDGSAATGITYNIYIGPSGSEVLNTNQSGTAFTYAVAGGKQMCAFVTAVENGVESARTPEVCGTSSFPVPAAPTGLTVK